MTILPQTSSQFYIDNIKQTLGSLVENKQNAEQVFNDATTGERKLLALKKLADVGISLATDTEAVFNRWHKENITFKLADESIKIEVMVEFDEGDDPPALIAARRRERFFGPKFVNVDQFAKFVRLKTETKSSALHHQESLNNLWEQWIEYVCVQNGAK